MEIIRGKIPGAKKIVVYGPEGIGKSTFASRFPDPLFIDTEGSTRDMDVARFEKASSWAMVIQQVQYVTGHPDCCKTLVIDTADWAEQMEIEELCDEKGWKGLEDAGYGKGYTYSAEKFGKFLNLLEDVVARGIYVVMTAHAQLRKVELPEEMGAYDHWEMKTSKKVAPMIREWADAVFFVNYKTRIVEVDKKKKAQGGQRVMYTTHTPFWDAKNRFGLPDEMAFDFSSIAHIIQGAVVHSTMEDTQEARRTMAEAPEITGKAETTMKDTPGPQAGDRKGSAPVQMELPINEPDPPVAPVQQKESKAMAEPEAGPSGGESPEIPVDNRVPKVLRDLMIAGHIGEWDLQNVVNARLPGAFPYDMPVRDYPMDFINEWILPNWDKVVKFVEEARKNAEIPFN